jgi:hypothetical protein
VPQGRIELPTSPLPRVRSTTELLRREGACPIAADCATRSAISQVPRASHQRKAFVGAAAMSRAGFSVRVPGFRQLSND